MPGSPGASPDLAGRDGAQPTRTGGGSRKPRLIVVSNRVSVPNGRAPAAGGLAVALQAALGEHGGLWFGWSGESRRLLEADPVTLQEVGPITYALTDLSKQDVDEYYAGFSNRALWPVCHYRLDLASFSARETAAYFRVNERFARNLARLIEPNDLVWVHDYHLLPLGRSLRDRGVNGLVGFFMHIPWPAPEVASALPEYVRILSSMASYDLVGFQTARDAENFGRCLQEEGVAVPLGDGLYAAGERTFRVAAFPIGIDTPAFRSGAAKSEFVPAVKKMLGTLTDQKLIIGVDRLDYSKGLRERMRAFCTYVTSNPEARRAVTYLQVTPKSRSDVSEYRQMQREVATQVGEVNGTLGELDWTPIRYLNQNVPHTTLTGLYRMARVGLVTPLRDGMNLVAKEYVASQSEEDPGVLVLSRYAGAAEEMDGALVVNPYDTVGTAGAIGEAMAMPLDERQARWRGMMDHLDRNTVGDWWRGFMTALATRRSEDGPERLERALA